jgi:hypothetical protein
MSNVPKIVLKQLQTPAGEHPDADLLAAFAEQSLPESERNLVLSHLSLCSDCREVIALALPATEAVSVTVLAHPARAGWLAVPALRWGVVAAGVLVVTSFGILQYQRTHLGKEKQLAAAVIPRMPIPSAPVQTPAASAQTSAAGAVPRTEEKMQFDKRVEARKQFPSMFPQSKSASDAGVTGVRVLRPASRASGVSAGAISGSGGGIAPGSGARLATNAPAIATVEAQGASLAPATNTPSAQASDQIAQNQVQQLPLPGRNVTDLSVARAKDPVPAAAAAMQAPSIALHTSPSLMQHAAPRWMITSSGGLRRSLDAGLTWEDVNVNADSIATPNPVFRALAATGSEVWAGGSNAVLYHSLDAGAHWTRVMPLSAGAELTGDITAVDFSDLQHGKITTSTPEVWTTADDGHTWQKQP